MARPKGSTNKSSKAAPAASGPVTTDHNERQAETLTDDQRRALFFIHRKDYAAALEKKKVGDALFKNVCKTIKSEGTNVEDIKLSLKLEEGPESDKELQEDIEAKLRVARWMNSTVGTQFEMFGGPDRTPLVEKEAARGKRDGLQGKDATPPAGPEVHEAYMKAWHDGQGTLMEAITARSAKQRDADNKAFEQEEALA